MYKFVVLATLVCYSSAGVISLDNGWDNGWKSEGWNNDGWNNEGGWNNGWDVAPKVIAAPTIVKTIAAPTIVKTLAVKQGATSYANSNLWSFNPVPVSVPVVQKVPVITKVAAPVYTKVAAPVYTKIAAPITIEKSWGGLDGGLGWSSKW